MEHNRVQPHETEEAAGFPEYLSVSEAARRLPHRPSPSAVWRWITKGVDVGGRRIRLASHRFGKRLFIDERDLVAFGRELGLAHADAWSSPATDSPPKRRRVRVRRSTTKAPHADR